MCDAMSFPATVEEFMESYKIVDCDHVYSNGMEMVPIFRMKQWFEHEHGKKDAEMTDEQFEDYCRKRCLSVVTNEFMHEVRKMVPTPEIIHSKDTRWIPCCEKLPKEEGYFFVTDEAAGMAEVLIDKYIRCDDGKWAWLYSQHAIAWMPLPEPYKEGGC